MESESGPKLIRVGVRNKGCAGMSYHLEYIKPEEAGRFAERVKQDGVEVLLDRQALFSIIGSEMDWQEDRLSAKFVPRSAEAFLEAEGARSAAAEAWGMVAALLGSLASSAAREGVRPEDGAGSEAVGAGVAGDGVGAGCSAVAATRGSFCDLREAGDDGDIVAQAGSMLAVSVLLLACESLDEEDEAEEKGGAE